MEALQSFRYGSRKFHQRWQLWFAKNTCKLETEGHISYFIDSFGDLQETYFCKIMVLQDMHCFLLQLGVIAFIWFFESVRVDMLFHWILTWMPMQLHCSMKKSFAVLQTAHTMTLLHVLSFIDYYYSLGFTSPLQWACWADTYESLKCALMVENWWKVTCTY